MAQRCYSNLHTFIHRLIKKTTPETTISSHRKDVLNDLIKALAIKYIDSAISLCKHVGRVTIDREAIKTLTRIWIDDPNEILSFADSVWDHYLNNPVKGVKKAEKSGLILPPARFKTLFKERLPPKLRVGDPAAVYLAAVIEYTFTLIIAGDASIPEAIQSLELRPLFFNNFIIGTGYI